MKMLHWESFTAPCMERLCILYLHVLAYQKVLCWWVIITFCGMLVWWKSSCVVMGTVGCFYFNIQGGHTLWYYLLGIHSEHFLRRETVPETQPETTLGRDRMVFGRLNYLKAFWKYKSYKEIN